MNDLICSFPSCDRTTKALGFCSGHAEQRRLGRPLTPLRPYRRISDDPVEWFLSWFDRSGGPDACHEWQRDRTKKGYGHTQAWFGRPGVRGTHILMWELVNGPIPKGLQVRHIVCDNPPCGNIRHLAIGTPADNTADMLAKGRESWGERSGSARLVELQVRDIRLQLSAGVDARSVAEQYGVSVYTIYDIGSRRTWKHLSD